jgi:hypothetical protein
MKIASILTAGSVALTPAGAPALGQPVEGRALAYISIPLDGSTGGAGYGLRLDLRGRDGAEPDALGRRPSGPPPVLEMRFGMGEEPGELRLGDVAATKVDRLDLDTSAQLWIWTGVGLAALVALVVATDTICIGINASCTNDKDDNDDNDDKAEAE